MGFFNLFGGDTGGSTSSTSTTNTKTSTPSAVASDESFSISIASDGAVTVADPTTIERAFRFASESLGLVERAVSNQQKSAETALIGAINQVGEQTSGGAQRLLWYGAGALAALVGLAWVIKR